MNRFRLTVVYSIFIVAMASSFVSAQTALIKATKNQNRDAIEQLLNQNVDLNESMGDGLSLIHI